MKFIDKVRDVQKHLAELKIDGWLIYDFRNSNDLAHQFLEIKPGQLVTRRFFYWIPVKGEPVRILHQIEFMVMDHVPGEKKLYLKWQTLEAILADLLKGCKRVAMEYSERNHIPYVSRVDAGTVELIRSFGVEVVSSADFLQYYTCVWNETQLKSHLFAADVLDQTAAKTWARATEYLQKGKSFTECDMQEWILEEIDRQGCTMGGRPSCGVNKNISDVHYIPEPDSCVTIKKGDFILIDLWCKPKGESGIYADISRVGVAAAHPTPKQQEIFNLVRRAQKAGSDFVQARVERNEVVKGYEVDQVCRKIIDDAGYGEYFMHRTGHNIHTQDHGPGTAIDSLETFDDRPLLPRTCFSIEPGIYLPEFGVRLEYDVYITDKHEILITGGIQDAIVCLL